MLLLHDARIGGAQDAVNLGIAADVVVCGQSAATPRWSWLEVVRIHPGRAVVVVGECDAPGDTEPGIAFRATTSAVARMDLPPWLALGHLDSAAAAVLPSPVTMTYAVLDAVAGEVQVAQAGALPPVAYSPDRRPTIVAVPVTAPLGRGRGVFADVGLGMPYRSGLVIRTAASLGTGAAVASGLSGRRRTGDGDAFGQMVDAAQRIVGARPPGALIGVLARRGGAADVVRRRIPVMSHAPRIARHFAVRAARRWPVDPLALGWVVGEAVSNAVRHATDCRSLEVRVARLVDGALVEVVDSSAAPPQVRLSSWLDDSGRGLSMLASFAADWGFRWTREGKVVWAHVAGSP